MNFKLTSRKMIATVAGLAITIGLFRFLPPGSAGPCAAFVLTYLAGLEDKPKPKDNAPLSENPNQRS